MNNKQDSGRYEDMRRKGWQKEILKEIQNKETSQDTNSE